MASAVGVLSMGREGSKLLVDMVGVVGIFLGGRKTMQTQKTNTTSQNHNTLPNKNKGVRDEI